MTYGFVIWICCGKYRKLQLSSLFAFYFLLEQGFQPLNNLQPFSSFDECSSHRKKLRNYRKNTNPVRSEIKASSLQEREKLFPKQFEKVIFLLLFFVNNNTINNSHMNFDIFYLISWNAQNILFENY